MSGPHLLSGLHSLNIDRCDFDPSCRNSASGPSEKALLVGKRPVPERSCIPVYSRSGRAALVRGRHATTGNSVPGHRPAGGDPGFGTAHRKGTRIRCPIQCPSQSAPAGISHAGPAPPELLAALLPARHYRPCSPARTIAISRIVCGYLAVFALPDPHNHR